MNFKTTAATAIAALMMAGGAQAATCTEGSVTYTVIQGVPDTDRVLDSFCADDNDSETDFNNNELFNLTGWSLGEKNDFEEEEISGDGQVTFVTFETADDDNSGFLDWEIANPSGYNNVALVLKQSSSFAAFLLDTDFALSGTWSTSGPGNSTDDISHSAAYYTGEPNVIPLPAAGWLLLAGIGGLAAFRRRKSV